MTQSILDRIERRLTGQPEPLPQIATVAVFHDGKILLGRRRDDNKFTPPGGHLEDGEPAIIGALRELKEESGIQAESLQHLVSEESDGRIIHAFRCDALKPVVFSNRDPDKEVQTWEWIECKNGLPGDVIKALHVKAEKNVLLKALGLV